MVLLCAGEPRNLGGTSAFFVNTTKIKKTAIDDGLIVRTRTRSLGGTSVFFVDTTKIKKTIIDDGLIVRTRTPKSRGELPHFLPIPPE
ncbi:hypothetical protein FGM00_11450 [Aggregatimonas sangjinii]|uniref:Uncharacterized protein n=1 Tax=Aggregatimonas sangjinii TaxID=2583587 RepID=A0A5B7SUU7_9FLAO|nr:hypothetical protein [Aggregatimonas sangjinii]QCX00691.1 hypothetical protein FGM00_11450 [Aggregatimonas sangjinii]